MAQKPDTTRGTTPQAVCIPTASTAYFFRRIISQSASSEEFRSELLAGHLRFAEHENVGNAVGPLRWAMQLLSVTVQRGNAEMYRQSGLIISREQGLRYDAGFAVPLLMS